MYREGENKSICLVLLIGSASIVTGVKINKLQVPEVIKHGAAVVLDCDFTLEEMEQDLVVKWYFNSHNRTLVYQWIPASRNRPQVLGVLKDRLNLEDGAGIDSNSVHRALHILEAGPDLSGDYTCSVSTMQSEDIRTKSMLVFVPERNLILRKLGANEGLLKVQCVAEGVFPNPEVSLYSQSGEITTVERTSKLRGQLYDVFLTATLPAIKQPEEFSCELAIPQANYSVKRETVIYPGNEGSQNASARWIIIFALLRQFHEALS